MGDETGWTPLDGVKLLDFTPLLPGPFATEIFADLGADVIKIEPPGGEFGRRVLGEAFAMSNRNKRSVVLDLKNPDTAAIVARLAEWADVAAESFRPGVADRLGIGYEALKKINPSIVYCSVSGYGQDGPARLAPGHDLNYLATAGALSFSGHYLEKPRRSGLPVADCASGFMAAIAILAALRDRDRTGKGAYLDVAIAEAALMLAATRGTGVDPDAKAHLHATNEMFECADGRLVTIGLVEAHFWDNFRDAVAGMEPRVTDPKYATLESRAENGTELVGLLAEIFAQKTSADWEAFFAGKDVPLEKVLKPAEALETDQVKARRRVTDHGGERHVVFPVHANGAPAGAFRRPPPAPGADTAEVLDEIGFGADEIAALGRSGALGGAS